jgi:hypothetical protein
VGEPLIDLISAAGLRPALLREIYGRLGHPAAGPALPPPRAAGAVAQVTVSCGGAKGASPGAAAGRRLSAGSPGPTGTPPKRAAPRARAAPPAAARRGGYMDAGGVGAAGELPEAPEVHITSERELRAQLEKAYGGFQDGSGPADWKLRMDSMLLIEGITLSGAAAEYEEAFDEALKGMRGVLAEQLLDRRSAVSRQACHLLAVLSGALGQRFDAFAAAMIPVIFKVRRGRGRICVATRRPGLGAPLAQGRGGPDAAPAPACSWIQPGPLLPPFPKPRPALPAPAAGDHGPGGCRGRRRVRPPAGAQPPQPQGRGGRGGGGRGREEPQDAAVLQRVSAAGGFGAGCRGTAASSRVSRV